MIDFACICGEKLSAPEDQAGGMLQCPRCNRLIDVPTLSDLKHLNTDGTYVLDEAPVAEDPNRFATLARAFASSRVDAHGNEIDLRNAPPPRRVAGTTGVGVPANIKPVAPIELTEDAPTARTPAPRYDPITGELIRAIDVTPHPAAGPAIPMAKAVLGYAAPHVGVSGAPSGFQILLDVFKPINAVVVLFVFLMHLFLSLVIFITLLVILPIILAFAGLVLCLGHWSVVVEAMGPDEGDELPRPLGNFQFGEDIWTPFCHTFFSVAICYLPAILLGYDTGDYRSTLVFALLGLGTAALPAVLLTMSTSRSILNLRPDRLLGVAAACGVDYLFAVLAGGVALTTYLLSFSFVIDLFISVSHSVGFRAGGFGAGYPLLFLSLFMMHGFCWYLGALYVRHHEKFPWPFLRHQKERQAPPRRKPSYVKKS